MSGRTVTVLSLVIGFFVLSFISPQPSTAVPTPAPKLEMWFIWGGDGEDVGTGTLLRGPNGTVVLFDGGWGEPWANRCKAVMDEYYISTIHYVIAGHYDEDHVGGLDDLNTKLGGAIDNFYDRGGTKDYGGDLIYSDYYELVSNSEKRHTVVLDGSSDIDLGGNATLRFLSVGALDDTKKLYIRGRGLVEEGINDKNSKSISALVTFTGVGTEGGFDLYLGSDLTGPGEEEVDDVIYADFGRYVDIMLVDHHGANTANNSSTEFLRTMDPEVAIISVWDNNHGHPNYYTVQRLQQVVEPDTQRIIRLAPGQIGNSRWAPETMLYCHTTNSTVYVTTDGYFYTVIGTGIDDPDLVNHAVDQGEGIPTPVPSPSPTPGPIVAEGFEDFDSGTRPTGWIFTNCNNDKDSYISDKNSGVDAPSIKLNATGDVITTETFANAGKVSLWVRGNSTEANSALLVEEFYSGGTPQWTTVSEIKPLPTTGSKEFFALSSTSTRLKFSYTKNTGNLAFDDVHIYKNSP